MKTNFNEQKGKPGGKGRKNKASNTVEKNRNDQSKNNPVGNGPLEKTPDADPRKNDPTGILQDDPWKETETEKETDDSYRDNDKDRDKRQPNSSTGNPLKNDPTGKMPSEKAAVTDPTIDENTINDSLF